MSKLFRFASVLVLIGVLVVPLAVPADSPLGLALKLRNAVTLAGLKRHVQALQAIADANGGTRASGTPGYNASVDYVVQQLRAAGYNPQVQPFAINFFQELATPVLERVAPTTHNYVANTDFATLQYSGSGDVTANILEVNDNQFPPGPTPSSSNAGCEAADFAGFVPGSIALIQRGTCTFHDKALNAQAAGASAVLIFNEGQPGRTDAIQGTLGSPDFSIPVLGTTYAFGEEIHGLLASNVVTVRVKTSTISELRQTYNVLAETRDGDPNRVVVQGSQLDSGLASPGMNFNASGDAYNLESAIQLARNNIKPRNKIRFAWWGAAMQGLVGSQFYVDGLSDADFGKILLYLDYSMLASPNSVRFVYDGDGSASGSAGPEGSAQIERAFQDYFGAVPTDPTPFDGTSDYAPFINRGAPAGGLFAGAAGIKTAEQAVVYGGTAGVAYDPCYLQACDTLSNLSDASFDQLSDAASTVLVLYGFTRDPVTTTTLHRSATGEFRGPLRER